MVTGLTNGVQYDSLKRELRRGLDTGRVSGPRHPRGYPTWLSSDRLRILAGDDWTKVRRRAQEIDSKLNARQWDELGLTS